MKTKPCIWNLLKYSCIIIKMCLKYQNCLDIHVRLLLLLTVFQVELLTHLVDSFIRYNQHIFNVEHHIIYIKYHMSYAN